MTLSGVASPLARVSASFDIIFMASLDRAISFASVVPLSPLKYWVIAAGVSSILSEASIFLMLCFSINSFVTNTLIAGSRYFTTITHGGFKSFP